MDVKTQGAPLQTQQSSPESDHTGLTEAVKYTVDVIINHTAIASQIIKWKVTVQILLRASATFMALVISPFCADDYIKNVVTCC